MREIFTGDDKEKYITLPLKEYSSLHRMYAICCLLTGLIGL